MKEIIKQGIIKLRTFLTNIEVNLACYFKDKI